MDPDSEPPPMDEPSFFPFYRYYHPVDDLFYDIGNMSLPNFQFDSPVSLCRPRDPSSQILITNGLCLPMGRCCHVNNQTPPIVAWRDFVHKVEAFTESLQRYRVCLSYETKSAKAKETYDEILQRSSDENDDSDNFELESSNTREKIVPSCEKPNSTARMKTVKAQLEKAFTEIRALYTSYLPNMPYSSLLNMSRTVNSETLEHSFRLLYPTDNFSCFAIAEIFPHLNRDNRNKLPKLELRNPTPQDKISCGENIPVSVHRLYKFPSADLGLILPTNIKIINTSDNHINKEISIDHCLSLVQNKPLPCELLLNVRQMLNDAPVLQLKLCNLNHDPVRLQNFTIRPISSKYTPNETYAINPVFVGHPRIVAYATGDNYGFLDLRRPATGAGESQFIPIFDTRCFYDNACHFKKAPDFLEPFESFIRYCTPLSSVLPFTADHMHLVSTNHEIFIIDDRNTNHIVNVFSPALVGLTDRHKNHIAKLRCLELCDPVTQESSLLMCVGSNTLANILLYKLYPPNYNIEMGAAPATTNFPILYNEKDDPICGLEPIAQSILERVDVPLHDFLPFQVSPEAFAVIQLSAYGDLFHQMYDTKIPPQPEKGRAFCSQDEEYSGIWKEWFTSTSPSSLDPPLPDSNNKDDNFGYPNSEKSYLEPSLSFLPREIPSQGLSSGASSQTSVFLTTLIANIAKDEAQNPKSKSNEKVSPNEPLILDSLMASSILGQPDEREYEDYIGKKIAEIMK